MGILGSIGGFIEDVADTAVDVAGDVAGGIADAAVAVGEAVVDAAGETGGYLGDGIGFAGSTINFATGGLAGHALDLVDDTVFDSVDYLTGGVIDIDFDDGKFGAALGIDGVSDIGVSIGENGIEASFDAGLFEADLGLTDEGLGLSAEAGIDWGPLPHAAGHLVVSENGDVMINGEVQGTIPIWGGLLSVDAEGGLISTDEGFGAYLDADGSFRFPSGTTVGAGVSASYMEDEHGSRTTFGAEGSISSPGIGSAGAGYGYERVEQDGNVFTHHEGEVHAEGYGIKVGAEADYVSIETDQGSFSQWTGDIDVDGLDTDSLTQLGSALLGADTDEVTSFLGQAAESGALGDLLGQMDPATTTALLERLVGSGAGGAPTAGGTVDALPDDVLGAAPADHLGAPDATGDVSSGLPDSAPIDTESLDDAGLGAPDLADEIDHSAVEDSAPLDEPAAFDPPIEPEPASDFDQTIAAADQVEDDVDTMFEGLE
jgi:hypothetical protein